MAIGLVAGWASITNAQLPLDISGARQTATTLPEPIYWRQNLFLIPYEWDTDGEPTAATSVWLYVSKDRGTSWQKLSEARPQVRAFNYHAEADGEYWFAIRTVDSLGNFQPVGALAPELRVIVDTSIPRFEQLAGAVNGQGVLHIEWRVADANVDPQAWQVEMQAEAGGEWLPVSGVQSQPVQPGAFTGTATLHTAAGERPVAVRVAAVDLAGNRAVSQTDVRPAMAGGGESWPAIASGQDQEAFPPTSGDGSGWVASRSTAQSSLPYAEQSVDPRPTVDQPWPADNERLAAVAVSNTNDSNWSRGGTDDSPVRRETPSERKSPFAPLQPYRPRATQPWETVSNPVKVDDDYDSTTSNVVDNEFVPPRNEVEPWLWLSGPELNLPPGVEPRLVNSRSFVLEYELENVGPWGVSKVELWGTRDGGQTWRSFAIDDDHTSPMQVAVGGAGLYGFRIVVSGGGGVGGFPPRSGDRPELWVGVDLHRPQVELTGAEPGSGELAGHMLLRWWADDDNLKERPIGLFYSSRPVGPWTAVATNLANSGEYPWRLERHLPPRVYLRLEARDTAGNLAAFQTHEPVSIQLPPPSGRIEGVESFGGPTAWSSGTSPR